MPQDLGEILSRNVSNLIVKDDILRKLRSGRKLRVKLGIDPTSPDLHLGHAVVLRKLKEFQELGHKIILIIGDFTAKIGDPTGASKTRPPLSDKEIKKNMKNYLAQAGKILDIKKTEVLYNRQWLEKLSLDEIFKLLGLVSVNQLLEREDFSQRLKEYKSIRVHELLYPIMQAYDSVIVKADLECGGTDQTFNLLMGRQLMERLGASPQDILTVPLLEGTDGKLKMSKSFQNYIALNDPPHEMFGKVMSIKDELIDNYFLLATDFSKENVSKLKKLPKIEAKEKLAFEIVKLYYSEKEASKSRDFFRKTFREKNLPEDVLEIKFKKGANLSEIILKAGLIKSRSEFRRLLNSGAIEFNSVKIKDPNFRPDGSAVLRVGKKKFVKLVLVK